MNRTLYFKNQLPFLLINIISMSILSIFLLINKNSLDSVILILIVWNIILIFSMTAAYQKRKKQLDNFLQMMLGLEERYLIAELINKPERADDQVFYQILKMSSKSMLEQIGTVKRERVEYKEYIEQWIHEIKTPITAIKLLCENNRSAFTKEVMLELERINRYTEQALYYTRSEHTEKDYLVRELNLFDIVHQAIADNKYLLLKNHVNINIEDSASIVYSDEKWVRFILNQVIVNAIKYKIEQPILNIYTKQQEDQIILYIQDNGIGIIANDLPRVFEKGFTGQNGRCTQNSTGIGLYLCKRLCDKLGIGLKVCSPGQGTTVQLFFQINHFIHQVQD